MKTVKLTSEQLEIMSYTDVANLVLTEYGKKMKIQDLFQKVIKLMQLPEEYFESKIGDFFGLLSTDKRFIMVEKGYWDLRDNHSSKISLDALDDEDEEEIINIDSEDEEIEDEEEVIYDEETVDDDEDDSLKDLVIMDTSEESDDLM